MFPDLIGWDTPGCHITPVAAYPLKAYTVGMVFEWNDAKHERNLRERGFGFDFAALIFEGPTDEIEDDRRDYGETRMRAIGQTGGFILTVIYTDRGDTRRVISARQANAKERKRWLDLA